MDVDTPQLKLENAKSITFNPLIIYLHAFSYLQKPTLQWQSIEHSSKLDLIIFFKPIKNIINENQHRQRLGALDLTQE